MSLADAVAVSITNGDKFFFLLGAGASIAAHIPLDREGPEGLAWALAITDTGDNELAEAKFGVNVRLTNLLRVIGKARFRQLLIQQNWQVFRPTICHEVLARLALEQYPIEIATVNYDPLAERAFEELEDRIKVVCSPDTLHLLREPGVLVLKIHGCPYEGNNPEHLLVTEEDLRVGRGWIINIVRARAQERHCVYVGFSFNVDYIVESVSAVAVEVGREVLSTRLVDVKEPDEVFAGGADGTLSRLALALGLGRENYSGEGADDFAEQLGNKVARIILANQLELAIPKANEIRNFEGRVELAARAVSAAVIDRIDYPRAYDFVARLKAEPGRFKALNAARDDILSAFKWILALISSGLMPQAAVAPALAYPLRMSNAHPPVLIFAGDSFEHIDDFSQKVEECFRRDPAFRRAIGCTDDASVLAIAVRCVGDATSDRGWLLEDESGSLLGGDSPFIWRSEGQLYDKFRNNAALASLV